MSKKNTTKIENIIGIVLMVVIVALQFIPCWTAGDESVSIAALTWFPKKHTAISGYLARQIEGFFLLDFALPAVLTFVFALIGIVTAIRNPKSHMVAIFPIISALSGLFSTLLNPVVMISSVWIPYMIVCILMLAVAAKCLICGIIAKRKAAKAFIV